MNQNPKLTQVNRWIEIYDTVPVNFINMITGATELPEVIEQSQLEDLYNKPDKPLYENARKAYKKWRREMDLAYQARSGPIYNKEALDGTKVDAPNS